MLSSVMLNLEVTANKNSPNSSEIEHSLKKIRSLGFQNDHSNGRRWLDEKRQNQKHKNSGRKTVEAQKIELKKKESNGYPKSSLEKKHTNSSRQPFERLSTQKASKDKYVSRPVSSDPIEDGDKKDEKINIAAADSTSIPNNCKPTTLMTCTPVTNEKTNWTTVAPVHPNKPLAKPELKTKPKSDVEEITNENKTSMTWQLNKSNETMCDNDDHTDIHQTASKEQDRHLTNAANATMNDVSKIRYCVTSTNAIQPHDRSDDKNVKDRDDLAANGSLELFSRETDYKNGLPNNCLPLLATSHVRIQQTGQQDTSTIKNSQVSNDNESKMNEESVVKNDMKNNEKTNVDEVKTKEDKLNNRMELQTKVGVDGTSETTKIQSTIGEDTNNKNQTSMNINNDIAAMIQALRSASMLNSLSMPNSNAMTIPTLNGNGIIAMDSSTTIASNSNSNTFDGSAVGNNALLFPQFSGLDTSHWNNFDSNACFTDKLGLKTWTTPNAISNSCYFPSTFYPMWTDIGMVSGAKNTLSMSATAFSKPSNVNDKSENESIAANDGNQKFPKEEEIDANNQNPNANGLDFNVGALSLSAFTPSLMSNYGIGFGATTPIDNVYSNPTFANCTSYSGSMSTAFPDTWKYPMNTTNDGTNANVNVNTNWGMEPTDEYSSLSSFYGISNLQMPNHPFVPFYPLSYSLDNSSLQSFGSLTHTQTSTATANGGIGGTLSESEMNPIPTEKTLEETHNPFHLVVGDQVFYGNQNATVMSFDMDHNPPQAQIHIHSNNYSIKIPISHLKPHSQHVSLHQPLPNDSTSSTYHQMSNNPENEEHHKQRKNHFQRLSEETLMKLPHLRKHKEYIKTIDIGNGPRDYNAFREVLNVDDDDKKVQDYYLDDGDVVKDNSNANASTNWSQSQIQSQSQSKSKKTTDNHKEVNNNEGHRHNKKKGYCQEKSDLYKTELCENWISKGHCTYGRKCHFAHGFEDMRFRVRVANYKTQPCCDPARSDSRLCLFGKRCNYAHPGEPLRCTMTDEYLDEDYFQKLASEFTEPFPFGIYM